MANTDFKPIEPLVAADGSWVFVHKDGTPYG